MTSLPLIKILFVVGIVGFAVFVSVVMKNDTERLESVRKWRKQIKKTAGRIQGKQARVKTGVGHSKGLYPDVDSRVEEGVCDE